MLYAILIYGADGVFDRLSEKQQEAILAKHGKLQETMKKRNALGAVARLMESNTAVSLRPHGGSVVVTDGPFAESKEHLLGFYLIECATMDEAIEAARLLPMDTASYEIRPVHWSNQQASDGPDPHA
ncbi:YciI family protein [Oricola cellulosilytica]|uniref:YciI family protein n=1 Tax=Oricola cellulosilytica TaxID=1429082 RepID=A0A4R0P973_9HYPH|nr:YciI family protein [Oricola cellulosilytica]TCD13730.1 YciI family protein [Oricola cellulosilytica]